MEGKLGAVEEVAVAAGGGVEGVVEAAFHLLDEPEVILYVEVVRDVDLALVDRVDEQLAEVGLVQDALAHDVKLLGVLDEDDIADALKLLANLGRPVHFARRVDGDGLGLEPRRKLAEYALRLLGVL